MIWLKLTFLENSKPCWVNLDAVVVIWQGDGGTSLRFSNEHWVLVQESPETIFKMMREEE